MVKQVDALVGVEENDIPVTIDASELVEDVKDKIVEKQKYDFAASKLELVHARKADARLSNDDQALEDLEERKIRHDIQVLMDGEKMQVTKTLQHRLFVRNKMPQPSTDQIHMLVVMVPEVDQEQWDENRALPRTTLLNESDKHAEECVSLRE